MQDFVHWYMPKTCTPEIADMATDPGYALAAISLNKPNAHEIPSLEGILGISGVYLVILLLVTI